MDQSVSSPETPTISALPVSLLSLGSRPDDNSEPKLVTLGKGLILMLEEGISSTDIISGDEDREPPWFVLVL